LSFLRWAAFGGRQGVQRGVVELDTLKLANQNLINTLEEVRRIQTEGAAKRREAEVGA
jgi:uncharacterized protein YaaN involved in tellurite resistance